MSFAGEYSTYARSNPNNLAVVLEVTLNEATWNPGNGVLTTAMNVSDRAVKARSKAYDPRVIRGGWRGIRQTIELRSAGLSGLSTSVTVADPDDHVRNALINGDNRQSAAVILRVVPGSDDDYDTRFTGLLDSWEFLTGQVRLNFKTDERNLRAHFPAWPYLKSEWFQMDPEFVGKYAALVYGKHDSTSLNLDHGMVPTVPVWLDGTSHWYATNLGPASFIKDVYVDGVLKTETTDYDKVYGSLAGGKTFTIIGFVNFPADDAVVTADLYGYQPTNATFLGSNVITNPVTQIRHFLVNFAIDRTRGYIPGSWNTTATLIDGTSWDAAATFADNHGLEGSRFMDEQKTALSWLVEWCESFPMFRPFWNNEGKIEMRMLSTTWPGYWDGASDLIRREDVIGSSFRYETDTSDVTGKISTHYLRDSVENKFLRSLDVQDLSVNELEDTMLDMYWSPARQA